MKYVIEYDGRQRYAIYPSENPTKLGMRVGFQDQYIFDTKAQAIDKATTYLQRSIDQCDSPNHQRTRSIVIYKSYHHWIDAQIRDAVKTDVLNENINYIDFQNRVQKYKLQESN